MRRKAVIVALVFAAAMLVTVPLTGMAAAEEHDAEANETEANGTDGELSLGERLSATMSVQERELDGDLEQRTVKREIERAGENKTEREEVVERRLEELESDLENLEKRAEILAEQRESGEISEAQFHAKMAELRVEAESKSALAEQISRALDDTDAIEEQQETVEAIVELRVRASEVAERGDDRQTRAIIDPDPVAPEEELRDSAEEMGERFAAVLERADGQNQQTGEPVRRVAEFPEEILDEEYTIAVEETSDGGTVVIDYEDRNVSYAAAFESRAEVEANEVEAGAVAYAVSDGALSIREADGEREPGDEPSPGAGQEVAEEIGDRLAETLERTDRRAQETNETLRNVAGFPEELAGEDYTIAVWATENGGSVQVQSEDGSVTYTTEFSATASVQSTELEGGPLAIVSDTDELTVRELDEDEQEERRAERMAEDAGEHLAAILERADRQAQERDTLVRGGVGLPEEIAGEEYTIAVRDTEPGGSVQIDVEESDVTYTTEFAASATVNGAELSGGPVRYRADTDEQMVRGEPSDDDDRVDDRMAAEVGDRIARLLKESDRQSEQLDRQVRGTAGFPEELGDQEYTIGIRNTAEGGLVEIRSEDGVLRHESEFRARGTVAESDVRGGPVRYSVSTEEVSIAAFDEDEREDEHEREREEEERDEEERDEEEREDEQDDDSTEEAREIAQRLGVALEDTDREAHSGTVTEEVSLPDDIEDSAYRIRIRDSSDGGVMGIYQRSDSGTELLLEQEFAARSTVQAGQVAGGDVVVRSNASELVVLEESAYEDREDEREEDEQEDEREEDEQEDERDTDDSDGDESSKAEDAAEVGDRVAETIVTVDREAADSGDPVRDSVDLLSDVGGEDYVVAVVDAQGSGVVEVREVTDDGTTTLLYQQEVGLDATVQNARIRAGGELFVEASSGELTLSS